MLDRVKGFFFAYSIRDEILANTNLFLSPHINSIYYTGFHPLIDQCKFCELCYAFTSLVFLNICSTPFRSLFFFLPDSILSL